MTTPNQTFPMPASRAAGRRHKPHVGAPLVSGINESVMKMKYKLDEIVMCPNPKCGKPMEDGALGQARNFIIHAIEGRPIKLREESASTDRCGWCEQCFYASRTAENEVTIEAIN